MLRVRALPCLVSLALLSSIVACGEQAASRSPGPASSVAGDSAGDSMVESSVGAEPSTSPDPAAPDSGREPAAAAGPGRQAAAAARRTPRRPHVVIYLIDTLRADHLGCYGAQRNDSPFIDSLAAESVRFERAISQAPWTLPSCVSLKTSTYLVNHGIVSGRHRVPGEVLTLTEWIKAAGYVTAGFVHNKLGGSMSGLDQGYDRLVERPATRDMTEEDKLRGLDTLKPFYHWLERQSADTPLYVYIHTAEPHHPYEGQYGGGKRYVELEPDQLAELNQAVSKHRAMLRKTAQSQATPEQRAAYKDATQALLDRRDELLALYDGDVHRADDNVHRVVNALQAKGIWDDTVFILLSDHGEEFFEHGNWFHDQSVYDELVHVPLIVHLPGGRFAGVSVPRPVGLIDVAPTLAELLGLAPAPLWLGRSLLDDMARAQAGEPAPSRPVFTQRFNVDRKLLSFRVTRGNKQTALLEDGFKAILDQDVERVELYDLNDDPGEQHDLASHFPERAASMEARIESWLEKQARRRFPRPLNQELDAEMLRFLTELGYLDR